MIELILIKELLASSGKLTVYYVVDARYEVKSQMRRVRIIFFYVILAMGEEEHLVR